LKQCLAEGGFAVTAEIVPPRGASLSGLRKTARTLRDWIDAADVTDGASAETRMAAFAGCVALLEEDVEPIMQLQCRDRNRIALQGNLLGASAIGVPNVLLLSGDPPEAGDDPDVKTVFDLDSIRLISLARRLRDEGVLASGPKLSVRPDYFIGCAENPFAPAREKRIERLTAKVEAGAQFVQTQYVFDVPMTERWMQQVRDLGLNQRCNVIASVGPIRSLRALDLLSNLPGVYIPDEVKQRVRSTPPERLEQDAIDLCSETIQKLREIPGIDGVHIIASGWDDFIPEVLRRAGIGDRAERDKATGMAARGLSGGRNSAD
jgi:methylenetetrahydrofolate reductase (NADPH)